MLQNKVLCTNYKVQNTMHNVPNTMLNIQLSSIVLKIYMYFHFSTTAHNVRYTRKVEFIQMYYISLPLFTSRKVEK